MKKSWMVAVVGGFLCLILVFGLAIALKSSRTSSKHPKAPVAVSEVKPRSAEEILLDAEAFMQRSDSQALAKEVNRLVSEFPNSYESYVTVELIGAVSDKPFTKEIVEHYTPEKINTFTCSSDDANRIIKIYGAISTIASGYNSAGLDKKKATDAVFRSYKFSNPDYSFAGLLEAAKSIDLTRRLAVGYESRGNQKLWMNSKLVPSKLEWLAELDNKKAVAKSVLDEDNKKKKSEIDKREKALNAKYRGVRLRAESGSSEAMLELSEMLRNGIGCEKNFEEADQWLRKSTQKTKN